MAETNYIFSSYDHAAFHTTLVSNLSNPRYTAFLAEDDEWFLQRMVEQNPDLIDTLFQTILMTFQSNVLDLHMIPMLVLLLFRTISGYLSSSSHPGSPDMTSVIRFLIDSLIDSHLFCLPDVKRKVVKDSVDTSLDLLRTTLPVIVEEEQRCCGWLFNTVVPARGSVRL